VKLAPVDKRTLAWMEDEIAGEVLREATEREAAAAEAEMDRRRMSREAQLFYSSP